MYRYSFWPLAFNSTITCFSDLTIDGGHQGDQKHNPKIMQRIASALYNNQRIYNFSEEMYRNAENTNMLEHPQIFQLQPQSRNQRGSGWFCYQNWRWVRFIAQQLNYQLSAKNIHIRIENLLIRIKSYEEIVRICSRYSFTLIRRSGHFSRKIYLFVAFAICFGLP